MLRLGAKNPSSGYENRKYQYNYNHNFINKIPHIYVYATIGSKHGNTY